MVGKRERERERENVRACMPAHVRVCGGGGACTEMNTATSCNSDNQ
jgi:hypothetical protein